MAATLKASNSVLLRRAKIAALAAALAVAGLAGTGGAERAQAAISEPSLQISARPFAIDGKKVYLPAAIVEGESYIGLRSLNDRLGIGTSWDPKTRETTLTGRGRTMQLSPASGYRLNGERLYASPAYVQAGSTFVPLRFVLESFGYRIGYDAPTKTVSIAPIAENKLTWQSEQITHEASKLSLTVSYPVLSGMENEEAQAKINAKLKSEAERYAATGRQTIEKAAKDNADAEKSNPGMEIPPVAFEGIYTIANNEAGLLSLYMDYYVYTGGAHGGTQRVPYTFDLKTGDLLSLKDVAGGSADYVSIINRAIQTQIKERKLDLLTPFKSIEADRPFFLRHGVLVIYFEQYEYTPYAAGMPEFAVPLSAFE